MEEDEREEKEALKGLESGKDLGESDLEALREGDRMCRARKMAECLFLFSGEGVWALKEFRGLGRGVTLGLGLGIFLGLERGRGCEELEVEGGGVGVVLLVIVVAIDFEERKDGGDVGSGDSWDFDLVVIGAGWEIFRERAVGAGC